MLRYSNSGHLTHLLKRPGVATLTIVPQRNLFVLSEQQKKLRLKSPSSKKPSTKYPTPKQAISEEPIREADTNFRKQFSELKHFTSQISDRLHAKDTLDIPTKLLNKAAEDIYETAIRKNGKGIAESDSESVAESDSMSVSQIPTASITVSEKPLKLDPKIANRLGLAVEYLASNQVKNWPMILDQLEKGGGLKGLTAKEIFRFIQNIPANQLVTLLPDIENMHQSAGVKISRGTYRLFLRALITGTKVKPSVLKLFEYYIHKMQMIGELRPDDYGFLIEAYFKASRLDKVEQTLREMKKKDIPLGKQHYELVMRGYGFNEKEHSKALQIFDGMKFLSQETKPDQAQYNAIIRSCAMNGEIEKALDLYQEMLTNNIPPDMRIISTLAVGCSRSQYLKPRAWEFMFQIYDNKWTPDIQTYTEFIYLAAQDGDVDMARALFYKLLETKLVTPYALGHLLLAYSKFIPLNERKKPFKILDLERGKNFRRNLVSEIDFTKPVLDFAFLPYSSLSEPSHVLAESNALWAYIVSSAPDLIGSELVGSYLNIAANLGDMAEFKDRYYSTTYFDKSGLPRTREVEIIEEDSSTQQIQSEESPLPSSLSEEQSEIKSPFLIQLQQLSQTDRYKIPRESMKYMIAVKAAGANQDLKFLNEIIKERGEYRRTDAYKAIKPKEQKRLDFEFAKCLVQAYTKMNLLDDALGVVVSSRHNFNWSWRQLSPLSTAASKIGNIWMTNTLRDIVSEGQIAHGGKVTKQQYQVASLRNKDRRKVWRNV
ncbi:CCM1 [[Candida] subhashii]|uniref:CCM1 n=1 Tax=[Candida] subhashii TaxID=561895 RepID=A0A8J5V453_9ASCO|nr:CCM1 [[Candida] subhashii]KAG7666395.1 CCM1 [[Candida] subhashii]